MLLGVTPTVDYAFKHLFGRDRTRPILINLLDSVLLPAPAHRIQDLELLNPFNPKEAFDDKLSILDIKARDQSGRQFNIEMQMLAFRYYEKRILYYASRLHQQQLHEGDDYLKLQPTLSISFLDHRLFPQVPDYHLRFRLLEDRHHFPFAGDLELHILELPKFTKPADELATELEIWLYFLRHAEKMDTEALPAALQQHPLVRQAVEELQMLAQTDQERERYEARRKAQLDYNTGLKVARLEGREEGITVGRAEGITAGRAEGITAGRAEGITTGRAEGITTGRREGLVANIHFCERLLHRSETPAEQLAAFTLEELSRLLDQLQAEVFQQRG
jgi:predicted transposase/invertase (TIGR01784 family)